MWSILGSQTTTLLTSRRSQSLIDLSLEYHRPHIALFFFPLTTKLRTPQVLRTTPKLPGQGAGVAIRCPRRGQGIARRCPRKDAVGGTHLRTPEGNIKGTCNRQMKSMQVNVTCVKPAAVAGKREAEHKSWTHKLLRPYKHSEGWNVLALGKGRQKLSDDPFPTFPQHYVADLPLFHLGLVVKKSECFPYIMDVDKSATKGGILSSPRKVLKVVVRMLKSVIGDTRLLFEHRNLMNYHGLFTDHGLGVGHCTCSEQMTSFWGIKTCV